jgi:choline dehydrogenase-like flavoprotein
MMFQPRFAASEELQRHEQLLGICGELLFDWEIADGGGLQPAAGGRAIKAAKSLAKGVGRRQMPRDWAAALRTVVRNPAPVLRAGTRYVLRRPTFDTSDRLLLAAICEPVPNPESRIYLSERRDALGLRRAVLDWRLTEQEVQSCRRFAEVSASEFERAGLGKVDLDRFKLPDDPDELSGFVRDNGHHMGATRMASGSDSGVVDSDCKVFGIDNLYLGNCGVFPTSGCTNPTFTLIALCIRIADTLKERTL